MKKITVILGLTVAFLALGAYKVFGQTSARITTACESTNGALYAVDDGFSSLTSCSKRQRLVLLGEPSGTGVGTVGSIVFIHNYLVLSRDGKIWHKDSADSEWMNDSLPNTVPIDTSLIVKWTFDHFLDTDGNYWGWIYGADGQGQWINLGQP